MKIKVIVFDLDDTLYDEPTYVMSGFKVVSKFISGKWGISEKESLGFMLSELEKGRGHIFDDILKKIGKFSQKNIREMLSIYRLHQPDIKLYPEAEACLKRLHKFSLYIVTDGNKNVQASKVKALELDKIVKHAFITYRHGRDKSKPSPYCFYKIASLEKADPSEIVYVGDNPTKDFIGIRPHGFKTIRVLTGQHKNVVISEKHEADVTIKSLDFLTEDLIKKMERDE